MFSYYRILDESEAVLNIYLLFDFFLSRAIHKVVLCLVHSIIVQGIVYGYEQEMTLEFRTSFWVFTVEQ